MRIALLCFALMMSGCSVASGQHPDRQTQASPTKRASPTASPLLTPKTEQPSGRPALGFRAPPCPDVDPAAYAALATPTALPPAKPLITPADNKHWIERLEGQVGDLKGHLNKSVQSHTACRGDKS